MVGAAGVLRIPAALTEADAHLGLANRLAGPFAERVFLRISARGPGRGQVPRRRAADPGALAGRQRRPRPGGASGSPPRGRSCSSSAEARAAHALERGRGRGLRPEKARRAPSRRGTGLPAARRAGARRDDYRLLAFTDDFGAALAAADLVVARAGGSVWEIAAAGKPALLVPYPHATADHQAKNARYFERGGGAVVVPEQELDLRRQVDDLLAEPARLAAMGRDARTRAARRRRRRRGGADRACPLEGPPLWLVGIGGAGLCGSRSSRRPGGRRSPAGTARDAVPRARPGRGIPVTVSAEPPSLRPGGRSIVSTAYAGRARGRLPRSVPGGARRASPLDRRRGRAREDDDGRDDRVLPRPARPRSVLPDRRRRAAARRQRPSGRRVARRRGRRVRPHRLRARPPTSRWSRMSISTTTLRSPRAPSSRSASRAGRATRTGPVVWGAERAARRPRPCRPRPSTTA